MASKDTTTEQSVVERCYRCSAALEGATVCPECGRKQYRGCYCGNQIPISAPQCSYCGADWSHSSRVVRKSRRSNTLSYKTLAQSAAWGALAALLAAGLLTVIVTGLARQSPAAAQGVPASILLRVGLALQTVGTGLVAATQAAARVAAAQWPILVVGLVGAAAGAVRYLLRGAVMPSPRSHSPRKRRAR